MITKDDFLAGKMFSIKKDLVGNGTYKRSISTELLVNFKGEYVSNIDNVQKNGFTAIVIFLGKLIKIRVLFQNCQLVETANKLIIKDPFSKLSIP